MGSLLKWLGLPPVTVAVAAARGALVDTEGADTKGVVVLADTNLKYEQEYCAQHLATERQRQMHCVAAAALQVSHVLVRSTRTRGRVE